VQRWHTQALQRHEEQMAELRQTLQAIKDLLTRLPKGH
jgi:hypothetical protein